MAETFKSRAEYEAAIAMAAAYLDRLPTPIADDDLELRRMIAQIAEYREVVPEVGPTKVKPLESRIDRFVRRRRDAEFLHRDGDGIGPTLGMDVSHS